MRETHHRSLLLANARTDRKGAHAGASFEFKRAALATCPSVSVEVPEGVTFVDIDRDTGALALPTCPRVYSESFLAGTEPAQYCELHRW